MHFEDLYQRLVRARRAYEDLLAGATYGDRADALTELHELRARMGVLREDVL